MQTYRCVVPNVFVLPVTNLSPKTVGSVLLLHCKLTDYKQHATVQQIYERDITAILTLVIHQRPRKYMTYSEMQNKASNTTHCIKSELKP